MIEPDHLDVHATFDEYVAAKANIVRHQTKADVAVYNGTNLHSRAIGESSLARQISFQSPGTAHVREGSFWYGERELCSVGALHLPGVHNQDNACAAIDAVWAYVQDSDSIASGLAAFSGLSHRLKFIREVNGIKYYDDSIATTPGSAIAAMRAFDQSKIIILGGSSKGVQYDEVASVAAQSNVKLAVVIGDEADKIEQALRSQNVAAVNLGSSVSMTNVVQTAKNHAAMGDVVILSPACASFGMFKNYSDRGDQFISAVNAIEEL
jgi:UDP-N-acetylmuramoylalanine--D-glutamate ligase